MHHMRVSDVGLEVLEQVAIHWGDISH